jgi:hypothetical protein
MIANLSVAVPPDTSSPVAVWTLSCTAVAEGREPTRSLEKANVIAAFAVIDPELRVHVTVCGGPAAPVTQLAAKDPDPPVIVFVPMVELAANNV